MKNDGDGTIQENNSGRESMVIQQSIAAYLGTLAAVAAVAVSVVVGTIELFGYDLVRDPYTLNRDLSGTVMGARSVREIESLISQGRVIRSEDDMRVWLLRSLTFVQLIDLERSYTRNGDSVSGAELNILYAYDSSPDDIPRQVAKTIGVLEGLRAAFSGDVLK